jgi:hypothetical protein
MGQYYKAVVLNKTKRTPIAFVSPYDFGGGAKLTETAWMKNDYVGFVEGILLIEPKPIVWAGDYADEEPNTDKNLYCMLDGVPKMTHDADIPSDKSVYDFDFGTALPKRFKYLVNHDKKEFVDKTKTPLDSDGWQVHPLPLLTCEGNGRGGGDFRGDEKDLVGRWSRDVIGVTSKKSDIPKDFKEVLFDLVE